MSDGNALSATLPYSLFISDLHLCDARPEISRAFLHLLQGEARHAERLYILGDLFEYWAGDDEVNDPHHQTIIHGLRALTQSGTACYFMHGNRDFLIGERFAEASGVTLLADPVLHDLYGKRVLLSHGDLLCTDDVAYQEFRQLVRKLDWQQVFLQQPLATRKMQIEAIRMRSESEKSIKQADIMDVNDEAVAALFSDWAYPELLIHGHTHRPACHQLTLHGHSCQRWVLGDWYEQGSYLRLDATGCNSSLL
ncbi:UDP-2,3-diacylglucosamine diphosphatase [Methylovorus sp. MP688]|uniref:UDP-2,3-diacylglucosamine diphosphatase n=1 Tax=Methylovorus sp. (strain MP688) TaxID=887061 RepID=UPI0001EC4F59|nr:UDP-2,3-diacylglucosamine diphosphatase [Methylovorus sp. MP688]ADQ85355.1 UDP-2,3-diacylglucosamine hydrolase [Methylovorus sp. MP688]